MLLARGPGLVLSPYIPVKRDGKRREVYHVTTPTACSCSAERKPGEPCEAFQQILLGRGGQSGEGSGLKCPANLRSSGASS